MLIGREVTVGSRNDYETSRPDDSEKFLADSRPFLLWMCSMTSRHSVTSKLSASNGMELARETAYPGRSLSCRRIHIESDGLESMFPEFNHIHTVATAHAEDFPVLNPQLSKTGIVHSLVRRRVLEHS